jgi:hypothetical protein
MGQKKIKKSQSFSMDILVVIAIVLFGVIFLVANKLGDTQDNQQNIENIKDKASEQSRIIFNEFKSSQIIDSENNVQIEHLLQSNIEDMKHDLNIDNDFCIVFEKDGKLVKIDPENNVNGFGSDKIIVNGQPCKSS